MTTETKSEKGGIGFVGLLTILFIGLKLTRNIDWPWLWVLSPLWITGIITGIIVAVLLLAALVVLIFKSE